MAPERIDFLNELSWRGLLHQVTDEAGLRAHLAQATAPGGRGAYAGFDPSADSLTIGNLVPTMMLAHFQRAGHTPVVVMGGGTGLIGDPSGKSVERALLSPEVVAANVDAQRVVFERVLSFEGPNAAQVVNNIDWLGDLKYVDVLRDVGKHFSINQMIQRDSVRDRLHAREQGISYTEFSYMILQALDFLHLWRERGITIQMGGSDQWGNIVSGCDLIAASTLAPLQRALSHARGMLRQENALGDEGIDYGAWLNVIQDLEGKISAHAPAFGLTAPLVTKADGGKFGKTETGAVWLTANRTSPYAMYQFWLNTTDADVGRFLRLFTFLSREEVEAVEAEQARDAAGRPAQRSLARAATTIVHGQGAMERSEHAATALFSGEIAALEAELLDEVLAAAPSSEHSKALLGAEGGVALVDLLPQTTLAKSKSEARQHLGAGAVSVNGAAAAADRRLTAADLLHGRVIALRRGKKAWHVTRWG